MAAEPVVGVETELMDRESPSMSSSLPRTSMRTELSSSTEALSSAASGSSLTGLTVTLTVAVAVPPLPSEML